MQECRLVGEYWEGGVVGEGEGARVVEVEQDQARQARLVDAEAHGQTGERVGRSRVVRHHRPPDVLPTCTYVS
jgi:hypothetical protein